MPKQEIDFEELWPQTLYALEHEGALLAVQGKDGRANAMTIGWGAQGRVWGKRVLIVLVRPSRYSYALLEEAGEFTVNVLPEDRAEDARFCGGESGRNVDKLKACGLTPVPGRRVGAPILGEGIIHYECRVVYKNDLIPAELTAEIRGSCYPEGDFHRVYFGEVLAVYADADAGERAAGP